MLKNYLKIAIRNLVNHKFYSIINILGLAVGIACCLLIALFVQHELSYDKFHKKADRIYRVDSEIDFSGNHFDLAVAPAPMAEALVNDYPEVEHVVRFRNRGSWIVGRPNETETFKERDLIFADASLFDVFSIPLIKGNPETALKEPNSLVISKKIAGKYFGDSGPIGKTLILDNEYEYKVTGMFDEIPENSHFHYDLFASMETLDESRNGMWLSNNFQTYIVLTEDTNPEQVEAKFDGMIRKYIGPEVQKFLGSSLEEAAKAGSSIKFMLRPLTDIHLYSDLTAELEPNSDIKYIYIFSAIAFFILVIACINFMNLATARSAKRAKEVGIRKTLGSLKRQLVLQFLTESIILSLIALVIAIGLVELFLPSFNTLSGKLLETSYFDNSAIIAVSIVITLLVGLLAGSYPAFFLSSFRPVNVLKGDFIKSGAGTTWIRSGLVIFQFAISIILIIGTAVIYKQLNYIQNKKLGFDKEQVVILHDAYALGDQTKSFKNEMLGYSNIKSASLSSYLPVNSARSDMTFWPEGRPENDNMVSMQFWKVDHDYVPTFGMEIVKGRNFSEKFSTDSTALILNEAAVKKFGFKDPIGKRISSYVLNDDDFSVNTDELKTYSVIGVVKDFHYESLRDNISPLCLMLPHTSGNLSFRVNTDDMSTVLAELESHWKKFAPGQPFEYSFLDDRFAEMYQTEQKIGKIYGVFAAIAIFIACLGLFGLAAFTAEQRTKEIGVRKVMGASVWDVVLLMSRQFSKLVIIAFILAAPISWMIMNGWLENFAYRTNISLGVFLLAGGLAFIIAWLTMSYQSVKAAMANPVNSLRSE